MRDVTFRVVFSSVHAILLHTVPNTYFSDIYWATVLFVLHGSPKGALLCHLSINVSNGGGFRCHPDPCL
jgi:hypothetical protein